MIWESISLMTVIDLFIIGIVIAAYYHFFRRKQAIRRVGATGAAVMMLVGLGVFGLFYLADLFTMFVLPQFMPMMQAMELMKQLHLNAMWLVMVVGTSFLVLGMLRLMHIVFPGHISAMETLEYKQEKAEQLSRIKDDFFAAMSHELRTPLTAIIGNCEHLLESENCGGLGCSQVDAREILLSIESAGKNQLALVNDILDISKIESGKFAIYDSYYDLAHLLGEVRRIVAIKAQDAGVKLIIEQQEEQDHLLEGDPQRIRQILINLLENAVKFTDEGAVTLTAWSDSEQLRFRVKDTGIGMPPETVDRLFKRFVQADDSISGRFGGSGLGLYISICLAEMMDGTIDVSSVEGEGSEFELILPYRPTETPVEPIEEGGTTAVISHAFNGHVLVAEDTSALQLLEKRILEKVGLTVSLASNGLEAVDLAGEQPFDLVLMDMQMPVMDGLEATRRIKSMDSALPVVALTANVMRGHHEQLREAGCDDILTKPIDKEELVRLLRQYLERSSADSDAVEVVD